MAPQRHALFRASMGQQASVAGSAVYSGQSALARRACLNCAAPTSSRALQLEPLAVPCKRRQERNTMQR
ncbi:hypothetical protein ON010_g852 [Phytophthora cinnamomi]|nr:hypothetical protein ON010_g852 [Phytophthora cinnamomi]